MENREIAKYYSGGLSLNDLPICDCKDPEPNIYGFYGNDCKITHQGEPKVIDMVELSVCGVCGLPISDEPSQGGNLMAKIVCSECAHDNEKFDSKDNGCTLTNDRGEDWNDHYDYCRTCKDSPMNQEDNFMTVEDWIKDREENERITKEWEAKKKEDSE